MRWNHLTPLLISLISTTVWAAEETREVDDFTKISYTLPFEVDAKLRLLGDQDVDTRAAELIRLLRSGSVDLNSVSPVEFSGETGDRQDFPPPFSLN